MAARQDFSTPILQGEDITLQWGATDVDLTGATVLFRLGLLGNEALVASSCTVTSGADGEYEVDLTSSDLSIAPGVYWYETRRTSGDARTLFYGQLTLTNSLFVSP